MQCREVRIKLSAYLDNELTDASVDEIREHLGSCQVCQAIHKDFLLSRYYLCRLKAPAPVRPAISDVDKLLESLEPVAGPKIPLKVAVAALAVAAIIMGMFVFLMPDLPGKVAFLKKPGTDSDVAITTLAKGKELIFDTPVVKMISVGKDSWISVAGKGYLNRTERALKIDLNAGSLALVLDESFKPKTIINAAGFQITTVGTEFITQLDGDKLSVELLTGKLLLSYKDQHGLKVTHLSPHYGASGVIRDDIHTLKTYQLSSSQLVSLRMRLDRIKQMGRWAQNNHTDKILQSGDIRIELWKEEQ